MYHAVVVIFLEFFAWGLLTTPMLTVSECPCTGNRLCGLELTWDGEERGSTWACAAWGADTKM